MAELIILTPEQLAERDQPRGRSRAGRRRSEARTRIIEEYKANLHATEPGYGGEVLLAEGEEKRVVRQNLQAAANELGFALDFRPIKDAGRLEFRVITTEERAARPRRGGRRKQQPAAPEQVPSEVPPAGTATEGNGAPKQRRRQRRVEPAA